MNSRDYALMKMESATWAAEVMRLNKKIETLKRENEELKKEIKKKN